MAELEPNQKRDFALNVLRRLREAGHEAYWAGGCVRDSLLGREPKDYDVATAARPDEIRDLFGRRKTLDIGAAFGVVAVVGPKPAGIVEVTTFRHDAPYSDGRHPDSVSFTSAEEDARRRDFTINGLFYDPLAADADRRVIDFVGGVEDLGRRVIRAIGDPKARFHEDKLRMLRGVRFGATFDFALEDRTRAAIAELAPTVTVVSAERIAQEMRALLVLPARSRGVDLLRETGLLAVLLPELVPLAEKPVVRDRPESGTLWQRTLHVLERLANPGFPLSLAALLHAACWHEHEPPHGNGERAAADILRFVADRWRLSNKETDHAAWLVEHHRDLVGSETMPWPRLQRLLISEGIHDLLKLHEAIALAAGHDTSHVEFCRGRLRLPASELNPPPLLSGDDLIHHGVPRGKIYKTLLEQVRDAQLDQRVTRREEALELVDRLLQTPFTFHAGDETATEKLGIALAEALPRPAVVALRGTLGAGKTRLVRALAEGLRIDASLVTSPTFVLVHEYPGETPLYHFDAYRVHGEEEFWQLGPEEYFSGEMGGITVVEWADRIERCLPAERIEISIEVASATERMFVFSAFGERYEKALDQLKSLIDVR